MLSLLSFTMFRQAQHDIRTGITSSWTAGGLIASAMLALSTTAHAEFRSIPGADGIDYKFWTPGQLCVLDPQDDEGNKIYLVASENNRYAVPAVSVDCPAMNAGDAEAIINKSRAAGTWIVLGDMAPGDADFDAAPFIASAVAQYPQASVEEANTDALAKLYEVHGSAFNYASDERSSSQVRLLDRSQNGFVVEISGSIFLGSVAARFTLTTAAPDQGALGAPIALVDEAINETFAAYDAQVEANQDEESGSN